MKKIFAFTLAEVLVTLGIIGIVAAMTLPTVYRECQKFVLSVQFKKTYSTLSQALQKAQADMGYIPRCYYTMSNLSSTTSLGDNGKIEDCEVLNRAFLDALNIAQLCEPPAYPSCIPKYKGFDTMAYERHPDSSADDALIGVRGVTGFYEENILYKNRAYALADGSIIINFGVVKSTLPRIFAVDINGKKGPNKWGYDLFSFWTGSDGISALFLVGTTYLVEEHGATTSEMLKDIHSKY